MEFHEDQLRQCCRVCGKRLFKAKAQKGKSFKCTTHSDTLKACFDIDISSDDSSVHPESFCFPCYALAKRKTDAIKNNHAYRGRELADYMFNWTSHKEIDNPSHV